MIADRAWGLGETSALPLSDVLVAYRVYCAGNDRSLLVHDACLSSNPGVYREYFKIELGRPMPNVSRCSKAGDMCGFAPPLKPQNRP